MKTRRNLLIFIILTLIISIIVKNLIGVANMQLIGKSILVNTLKTYIESGGDPDAFVMNWPWYYILINCFVFSIFWFLLGRIAYRKFKLPYWRFAMIVPVLYFFLSFDVTFIFYLLATLVGGVSEYARSNATPQAI